MEHFIIYCINIKFDLSGQRLQVSSVLLQHAQNGSTYNALPIALTTQLLYKPSTSDLCTGTRLHCTLVHKYTVHCCMFHDQSKCYHYTHHLKIQVSQGLYTYMSACSISYVFTINVTFNLKLRDDKLCMHNLQYLSYMWPCIHMLRDWYLWRCTIKTWWLGI